VITAASFNTTSPWLRRIDGGRLGCYVSIHTGCKADDCLLCTTAPAARSREEVSMLGRKRTKRVRASHAQAHTTKGWLKAAPKTRKAREALYHRCGAGAFLVPNASNPGMSKFPVMTKRGRCVVDCRGLRIALTRAKQHKYSAAYRKADALGKKGKCRWAV